MSDDNQRIEYDRKLIESLGGPAKVAERLGYEKDGGVQRVQNWMARGIPSKVKVDHPKIFLPHLGALVDLKAPETTGAP